MHKHILQKNVEKHAALAYYVSSMFVSACVLLAENKVDISSFLQHLIMVFIYSSIMRLWKMHRQGSSCVMNAACLRPLGTNTAMIGAADDVGVSAHRVFWYLLLPHKKGISFIYIIYLEV